MATSVTMSADNVTGIQGEVAKVTIKTTPHITQGIVTVKDGSTVLKTVNLANGNTFRLELSTVVENKTITLVYSDSTGTYTASNKTFKLTVKQAPIISGATVTLTGTKESNTYTKTTNNKGVAKFTNLDTDNYKVTVSKTGFDSYESGDSDLIPVVKGKFNGFDFKVVLPSSDHDEVIR